MKRILCIYLPDWPVQRVGADRPEREKRTVVLYALAPRGGLRVTACCAAARRLGVHVGMTLAEATSLQEENGAGSTLFEESLLFQEHDPAADRSALVRLARWCERFSPLVGLEAADEPSCLLLDVTGLGPLFGGEEALVNRVAASFHRRRYTARIALADTIGVAWALAHFFDVDADDRKGTVPFSLRENRDSPRQRRENRDSPRQPLIVPPGHGLSAIYPLPVEALRVSAETVDLLNQLGVDRIEQLVALPREDLAARFGDRLALRLDQAAGRVEETIVAERPAVDFQATWSLEHPTQQRAVVEAIVERLVGRVADLLARRDEGAVQLQCRLDCGEPVCLTIGLFRPTATASHLMDLLRLQLERLSLARPVTGVCIRAVVTAPQVHRQHELFDERTRHRPRPLASLLERLSSRLGRSCVVRPRRRADALPERAYDYVPATGSRSSGKRHKTKPAASDTPGPSGRPLTIHSPPAPLQVMAVAPAGPPVRFSVHGRLHRVARHWGPERIETGWWRGRSVRRDYYRVETGDGNRFWLFRQLADGKWFLHGCFE